MNHAQKIRLHVERKLTNFVQEDGATIPLFEQSFLLGDSARESTLFIPVGPGGTPENWSERPVGRAKQAALVTGFDSRHGLRFSGPCRNRRRLYRLE